MRMWCVQRSWLEAIANAPDGDMAPSRFLRYGEMPQHVGLLWHLA